MTMSKRKTNPVVVTKRGLAAIEAAKLGAPLWVLDLTGRWVLAGPDTLERAQRMDAHATWIYGVV